MATAHAAPLRIVCFFAVVFCGGREARAAPTVAYDQRQNGDFNLRVDLDDVAVVLLAGGDGAAELFPLRRDARPGEKAGHNGMHVLQLLQLAERRNGAAARPKKKNKKPIDCAAAAAEKPYVETAAGAGHGPQSPPAAAGPASPAVPVVPVDYETPQGPPSPADRDESQRPESGVPVNSGPDEYLIDDPYSVTPGTPDFSDRNSLSSSSSADNMVPVKTEENHRVDEFPENAVVAVKTAVAPSAVSTKFEENPISVSSDAKVVGEKSDETVAATVAAAPHDEAEVKAKIPADGTPAPSSPPQEPVTADGGAIVAKTAETPNDSAAGTAEKNVTEENPHAAAATNSLQTAEKKPEVPVELVAVKTVEKPTFAEALKADGKPSTTAESAVDGGEKPAERPAETSSASAAPVDVRVRANEKTVVVDVPTEMAKKPGDSGSTVVSGITTGTRPVELLKDKSAAAVEAAVVDSRLAAKPTAENMVAVKTIENAATTVTAGNAAVKTVVKSGNAKTTLLTNGSSIVRKVADRRPFPSATFEVAAPNVARA